MSVAQSLASQFEVFFEGTEQLVHGGVGRAAKKRVLTGFSWVSHRSCYRSGAHAAWGFQNTAPQRRKPEASAESEPGLVQLLRPVTCVSTIAHNIVPARGTTLSAVAADALLQKAAEEPRDAEQRACQTAGETACQ